MIDFSVCLCCYYYSAQWLSVTLWRDDCVVVVRLYYSSSSP